MSKPIDTLVILGAGGDLTSRLLLPGLATLLASTRGSSVSLIGVDRAESTDAAWRERVTSAFAGETSALGADVSAASRYVTADVTSVEGLTAVLEAATGRVAVYFALPPAVTIAVCEVLAGMELPDGIVLALEKPFGTDLASAKSLNRLLERIVPEEQVFRVDHFLGKSTVLDLLGLRFANRVIEPLFSASNVEKVELLFDEKLGLEGRAGYYDRAGALVDMVQSHLLLVLALVTMEPPASVDSEHLRGGMAQALRATRAVDNGRRARYTTGRIDDRDLPDYVAEPGVESDRHTETLAEVTLAVDNWRWAGVPFTLRSGKAIGDTVQQIILTFREVPHLPIGLRGPDGPSQLRISLKPASVQLDLMLNGADDPFELERVVLHSELGAGELSAYGEVLSGLLEGDPTLSVRGDVAEECWRIVEPVLAAWRANDVPLDEYAAGSGGPVTWSA